VETEIPSGFSVPSVPSCSKTSDEEEDEEDYRTMTDDYQQRFSGLARLYGAAGLERLRAAHVCVIGVGGVGSWTVEALARSGIGAITMIDLDDVCITNVNRQLPALDGQIGRPKIDVLADRVAAINPACRVERRAEFFTPATAAALLAPGYSFVIDATDRLANKCAIITGSRERGIPVLTCGSAGGRRDGTAVRVCDLAFSIQDELLRQVRRKLRREFAYPRDPQTAFGVSCVYTPELPLYPWSNGTCSAEPEPGSSLKLDCATGFGTATFVTGAFGFAAAGEVVRRLALE
jgi:tRNA A37 threonylcarbamoyladenosine dehydratase